jgi:hypothetical protein
MVVLRSLGSSSGVGAQQSIEFRSPMAASIALRIDGELRDTRTDLSPETVFPMAEITIMGRWARTLGRAYGSRAGRVYPAAPRPPGLVNASVRPGRPARSAPALLRWSTGETPLSLYPSPFRAHAEAPPAYPGLGRLEDCRRLSPSQLLVA